MEFSVDDGVTWVAAAAAVAQGVGTPSSVFLVQRVNPHIRYRVNPVAAAAGSKGPTVYAVSVRFAVANPAASLYRMTILAADNMLQRGQKVDSPGYGKDVLTFLDNIARQNEIVTFYEPDDSGQTAHSCWVMSLSRPMPDTEGVYDPRKQEGTVDLVLWETGG